MIRLLSLDELPTLSILRLVQEKDIPFSEGPPRMPPEGRVQPQRASQERDSSPVFPPGLARPDGSCRLRPVPGLVRKHSPKALGLCVKLLIATVGLIPHSWEN